MKKEFQLLLFSIPLSCSLQAQYFSKVTEGNIVTDLGDSRSVNWVDVNNDGYIDCFVSNGPAGGQNNTLYLNNGDGTFTAVTDGDLVSDGAPSDGATFADVDNDGDLDVFVVNWYNVNNLFYINDGSGNFTRITTGPLVMDLGYSETASFGDYNNDGLVDLYVTNSAAAKKNFLYENLGSGMWLKKTSGLMVNDNFASRNINWIDINQDGHPDIFVTNEYDANENLYINDGNGGFESITAGELLNNGGNTNSSSWGDFDNDGYLDVFLANYDGYSALFRNNGDMTFTKVETDTVALTYGYAFSSAWSDIDNDGDLDLFVTNAFLDGTQLVNFLYINNGDGTFHRNGTDVVTTDSAWSYGCAFGDYDQDGFQDLMVATCRYDGADQTNLLYHNNGNENHWISFSLEGTRSNRSAIGAVVRIKATIGGVPVWQMREVSAQSSYCGQNELNVHFGLGDADVIDSVIITWPVGSTSVYTSVSSKQRLHYIEPNPTSIENASDRVMELNIYPNPSTSDIIISNNLPFFQGEILNIIDSRGAVIHQISLADQSMLQLSKEYLGLTPGIYYFQFSLQNEVLTKKLTIK